MSRIDTADMPGFLRICSAEPRHQQRVRAEIVEEMVLDRHVLDPQHFGERARKHALGRRSSAATIACARPRSAAPVGLGSFLWSALLLSVIGMASSCSRIGRHHVGGKLAAQRLRDLAARQRRAPCLKA